MFRVSIIIIIIPFFVLLRISACNSNAKEIHVIESTELDILVKHTYLNRGIIYLNDTYFLRSWCSLLTPPPSWLKKSIYQYEEESTKIDFESINSPFRFIKHKGEKQFYVIKYRDTLRFELENSYE